MAYYNGNHIPVAVRPDCKLGALRTSMIGKHFAQDDGFDGYNVVEVLPLELTPTAADYLGGNDLKKVLVIPEGLPAVKLPVKAVFPNVITCVVEEKSLIVGNLDVAFADMNVKVVVPNTLKSAYESAYSGASNLTFDSWVLANEFTIPYIGDPDLTIAYVDLVVQNASGDISLVDKVIVPSDFTSYETDVFNYIFLKFENATEIEYGGLPSAYQAVEYIESTGTQFISGGTQLKETSKVIIDFQETQTLTYANYFGTALPNWFLQAADSSTTRELNINQTIVRFRASFDTRKTLTLDATGVYDGATKIASLATPASISNPKPIYIFNRSDTEVKSKIRLYSLSVYENDVPTGYYVPCYRKSDGEIGLCDMVNNQFYANAGAGTFLKGNDASTQGLMKTIDRPALSTCTIYYDENTSHTLTSAIVQNTLTRVPEFADFEQIIVPKWFTSIENGALDVLYGTSFISIILDGQQTLQAFNAMYTKISESDSQIEKLTIRNYKGTSLRGYFTGDIYGLNYIMLKDCVNITDSFGFFTSAIVHEEMDFAMDNCNQFGRGGYFVYGSSQVTFNDLIWVDVSSVDFSAAGKGLDRFTSNGNTVTIKGRFRINGLRNTAFGVAYSSNVIFPTNDPMIDFIDSVGTNDSMRNMSFNGSGNRLTAEQKAVATAKNWTVVS